MRTKLVYDWPTRIFHWLFAGGFVAAYAIANFGEDTPVFPVHMLVGLTLMALIALRVVWALVGTRYARVSSFQLRPGELLSYLKSVATGRAVRAWAGHNPASSWIALAMVALAVGLGTTGVLMTSGQESEIAEELHELFANTWLALVVLHVAGAILHTVRHRDALPMSMVDGRKQDATEGEAIASSRPVVGVVFAALVIGFATHFVDRYDAQTQTLQTFGTTLQLGENESAEEAGDARHGDRSDERERTNREHAKDEHDD